MHISYICTFDRAFQGLCQSFIVQHFTQAKIFTKILTVRSDDRCVTTAQAVVNFTFKTVLAVVIEKLPKIYFSFCFRQKSSDNVVTEGMIPLYNYDQTPLSNRHVSGYRITYVIVAILIVRFNYSS